MYDNIIFSSCGNDSLALIQWVIDNEKGRSCVVYSDTGWAAPWWAARVAAVETYCMIKGIDFVILESEGMEALVRRKKGWPMAASKMQFCTDFLKIQPSIEWLEKTDPEKEATCFVGIRRSESKNRLTFPEWTEESVKHGGRSLHAPLVRHTVEDRNELITKTGIRILETNSMECFPCVCSNREDLRLLFKYPEIIEKVSKIETEMGYTKNNKPRTMFRPYRHMGATGIKEVVKWSMSLKGKFKKTDPDQLTIFDCQSGFCGM